MRGEYYIVAIAGLIFLASAAAPAYLMTRTAAAKRYIANVEGQIGSARSREQATRSLRQLILDTEEERAALGAYALEQGSAATLIELLERDARAAGIAFEIGGVSVDPKDGPFDVLKVSMRGQGSFTAVMRLLSLIETIPYASTVDSAALERESGGRWSGTFTIGVLMRK